MRKRWIVIVGSVLASLGAVLAILYNFTCVLPVNRCKPAASPKAFLNFAERTLKNLGDLASTPVFQEVQRKIDECGFREDFACAGEALTSLTKVLIGQAKNTGLNVESAERIQTEALEALKGKRYSDALYLFKLALHFVQEELIKSYALCIWDFELPSDSYPHVRGILGPSSGINYSIEKDIDKQNRVLKIIYTATRDFDFIPIGLKKLNVTEYKYLIFAVKGDESVGFFRVELKTAGTTTNIPTAYIRDRLDGTWQWVIIPLEDFSTTIPAEPDELVFVFEAWKGAKKGSVYIDNLCFSKEKLDLARLMVTKEPLRITLDEIQKRAVFYFWEQANPTNGLIKDRSTENSPASIAAVGFGLTALIIGVERGWLNKGEVYNRILLT
ncbi:MAG: hypothetical protein QXP01_04955, partial [Candidatus Hadarchaeum sp.]